MPLSIICTRAKLESLRDTRYQEIGVVQRFNPLRDDVALEQLGVDLREARLQLAKQSELIADTNTQIERHQREIEVIENTLQGAPLGILQSIVQNTRKLGSGILSGGLIDVFRSMMDSLVELVSEVVPILLNLIALFVLQTMVFPLLFLYAFLRGFKAIWGISMADLARRGWQDIRQATQPTQP